MLVTQQPTIFVSILDCLTFISVSFPFSNATRLIRKANSTFMMFKRNLSPVISEATRSNTYKTLVLPIISDASAAWYSSKSETSVFLKFSTPCYQMDLWLGRLQLSRTKMQHSSIQNDSRKHRY